MGRKWRGALESAQRLLGAAGGVLSPFLLGGFKALGFDDVLRSGVIDSQAICGFLNCHLVAIDHGDQFPSLRGFDSVVAAFALGERRDARVRKALRLDGGRSRLGLTLATGGSRHVRDFILLFIWDVPS